jgi:TatA/E family protein of Tat protein translocase
MFGSLGVPELLLIFVVILIVFGPRRIPEIGRTLGKAMGEFRKATDDLKQTIEREVRLEELKKVAPPTFESFTTPSESVSRSEPVGFAEAPFDYPATGGDMAAVDPAAEAAVDPATAAAPQDEAAAPTGKTI